jgi:SAM-dependent methyltransferase
MSTDDRVQSIDAAFFDEYTSQDAILKYTRATAGFGIGYLLDHEYKDVYCQALDRLPALVKERGVRILEFGCGGGMNLIHLILMLREKGLKVEGAVGTDFSPALIEAAKREAKTYLREEDRHRIAFQVARNESLIEDLANTTGTESARWANSFHFILGVNTIRYCHRGQRETDCARDLMALLTPGGICVVIDMNDRFPAFRSTLKNRFRRINQAECYLPALSEYAEPFERIGFDILRKEHFCWIPHSAGKFLCLLMRGMSPILGTIAPSRAMRSLVVVQKPL